MVDSGVSVSLSDELIVYFKIYVFNSTGCWCGAVCNV
jgi:hypothetical protein